VPICSRMAPESRWRRPAFADKEQERRRLEDLPETVGHQGASANPAQFSHIPRRVFCFCKKLGSFSFAFRMGSVSCLSVILRVLLLICCSVTESANYVGKGSSRNPCSRCRIWKNGASLRSATPVWHMTSERMVEAGRQAQSHRGQLVARAQGC